MHAFCWEGCEEDSASLEAACDASEECDHRVLPLSHAARRMIEILAVRDALRSLPAKRELGGECALGEEHELRLAVRVDAEKVSHLHEHL
jgi:hypothetical protein